MSRSGYSDDEGEPGQFAMWSGQVASAIRGKRGQAFLREMAEAMDAMPDKRLIAHDLRQSVEVGPSPSERWAGVRGSGKVDELRIESCAAAAYHTGAPPLANVCAIGTVGERRGMPLETLDPMDPESIAHAFGIAHQLVSEIEYMNDEAFDSVWNPITHTSRPITPEESWTRMRAWVASQIRAPA